MEALDTIVKLQLSVEAYIIEALEVYCTNNTYCTGWTAAYDGVKEIKLSLLSGFNAFKVALDPF